MEKIICDVCGTSFSDTADQCPICGCARPESSKSLSEGGEAVATPRYTAVKGGRFSTKNVRKRIRDNGGETPRQEEEPVETEKDGTSIGLTIAVIALLVCICSVIVFIYFRFFKDGEPITPPETQDTTPIVQTTPPAGSEALDIPCTAIQLESSRTVLSEEGASWLLHVKVLPENTSDQLEFESKNPMVATVTADGKITAVSKGRTAIVIICGDITAEFEVVCDIPDPTTVAPTEETTVPPTTTAPKHENVRISATDVTLKNGEAFVLRLRDGSGETMDVVWEASKTGYVSIDGNTIKALRSSGSVTVSCTFEGTTYSCIIRLK